MISSSECPVGSGAQAGTLPVDAYEDVAPEEEGQPPVESVGPDSADIVKDVVGRIDESVEVAYLECHDVAGGTGGSRDGGG